MVLCQFYHSLGKYILVLCVNIIGKQIYIHSHLIRNEQQEGVLGFGGNWHLIIFWWIVLEAGKNLAGTGSTLLSGILAGCLKNIPTDGQTTEPFFAGHNYEPARRLFLLFQVVIIIPTNGQTTVPFLIWRELSPHYFPEDCFGGSSDWRELAPHYFLVDCFGVWRCQLVTIENTN